MDSRITVGDRIKYYRKKANLSQEALGRALGFDKSTIHRYESGKTTNIKLPIINAIAKKLGVKSQDLITQIGDNSNEMSDSPRHRLTKNELRILSALQNLDEIQQESIIARAELLAEQNIENNRNTK